MPSDIDTLHFYCDLCFNKHLYNEIFFLIAIYVILI